MSSNDQAAITALRKVNLVHAIIRNFGQLYVAHHADDFEFLVVLVELHEFPNRIFVRKCPSSEGFAANYDGGRIGGVVGSQESSPFQQRYAQGPEVISHHSFVFDAIAVFW